MSQNSVLHCGDAYALIAQRGAEPLAWSVAGRDLLWTADANFWSQTSPILFPIVGWANGGTIRVDGKKFHIGVHGFAAAQDFEIVARTQSSVRLQCNDTPATRAQFPFGFQLEADYALSPAGLSATFTVTNPASAELPYALGFHPGFAWPFAGGERDDYWIEFAEAERASVPIITAKGLFSERQRDVAMEGRELSLSDRLLANEALCWLNTRSRSLRFIAPSGQAIGVELDDFPHIALWSRPGAPFLSIEAWTGHGDPDGFTGDTREKPSMRLLAPGASARHAIHLTYHSQA